MTRPTIVPPVRTRPTLTVSIRWAIRRDRASMRRIDLSTATHGGRPAWGLDAIGEFLAGRNQIGMVAVHADEIVGYMLYALHRDRVEVADFVVAPECRRLTVGWQMMAKLKGKLNRHRHRLVWRVRETCLDAQLFARACGLVVPKGGVERGAFGDTGEDGYGFVYRANLSQLESGEDQV